MWKNLYDAMIDVSILEFQSVFVVYMCVLIGLCKWVVLQKLSHFKCMEFKKLTMNFFNFFLTGIENISV